MNDLFWTLYVASVIYCMWRIIKRYGHYSHDGVIGPTPGLDILVVVVLAPIYAVVDIVVTIINFFRNEKKE